ncbi:nucleoside hydrolase [Pontibacter toksunensis]|uniref:Nucleoside hydrolase n=1 Tax=Pontibacter toksunensis TaxID=1332631 RepID=A0ABW6C228_9BACT
MKNILRLLLAVTFCTLTTFVCAQSPVKVILDTDIDSDVDDVGALAMLHTFADNNVAEILGIIVTSEDKYATMCTDAINHYFGRPDIPIGALKGVALRDNSKYTRQISQEFPHDITSYEKAEDGTALYRKLLASQPDTSVVIITIGHLTNLRNLIESKPDKYSKLSGVDLIKRKVKLWSCMGGAYPEGKEANFYRPDPASTKVSVVKWSVPVVFAGWEVGNNIITGGAYLQKSLPEKSPVWRSYQLYNNFQGRPSWDQVSVLYAVSSSNDYWDLKKDGQVVVAEDGSNKWLPGKSNNQAYLVQKMNPVEVAKVIDALMAGNHINDF